MEQGAWHCLLSMQLTSKREEMIYVMHLIIKHFRPSLLKKQLLFQRVLGTSCCCQTLLFVQEATKGSTVEQW